VLGAGAEKYACSFVRSRSGCLRAHPGVSRQPAGYPRDHGGLTLLHHDRDFGVIARVTGQPVRWYGPD